MAGAVVGVSDFLMTALAKGTVVVGKKVGAVVADSEVRVKAGSEYDVQLHVESRCSVLNHIMSQ